MCRSRIRVPEQWYGDYLAVLGAARIGERRLKELVRAVRRRDRPTTSSTQWLDYSERRMAAGDRGSCPAGTLRGPSTPRPVPRRCRTASRSRSRSTIDAERGPDRGRPARQPRLPRRRAQPESRACATAGGDDRRLQRARARHARTTPAASGASTVLLREGCVAGIPRVPALAARWRRPTSPTGSCQRHAGRVRRARRRLRAGRGRHGDGRRPGRHLRPRPRLGDQALRQPAVPRLRRRPRRPGGRRLADVLHPRRARR